jgi:hypothetical protein
MSKSPGGYWISLSIAVFAALCAVLAIFGGAIGGLFGLIIYPVAGIFTGGTLILLGLGIIVVAIIIVSTQRRSK